MSKKEIKIKLTEEFKNNDIGKRKMKLTKLIQKAIKIDNMISN